MDDRYDNGMDPFEEDLLKVEEFSGRNAEPEEEDEYGFRDHGTAGRRRPAPSRAAAYILTAVIVTVIVIAVVLLSGRKEFEKCRVLRTERLEDTVASSYSNMNGNILQYGPEGARLQDRQGGEIWSISYDLKGPKLVKCGNTAALYGQGGTSVVVAGRDGLLGKFTTKLPIVKASVSEKGNVAAILEDDSNTWIEYYSADGTEIAAIRTSIDNPGYPMDVSVSPNGELLAVAYLGFSEGLQKGEVYIYSFGTAGQDQMDNRIGAFSYSKRIIPEVEYLSDGTCAVFRDDGVSIIEGSKVPKVSGEIDVDREICSVFYDSGHIGMVLAGDEEGTYRMRIWNASGGEILDQPFDFPYSSVEIYGSEVSLYNGSDFCVYGVNGKQKFRGSYTGDARDMFAVGKHRYVAVTDNGFELLELQ